MSVKTKITKKIEVAQDTSLDLLPEAKFVQEEVKEVALVPKTERTKKRCFYCQNKKEPNFTDSVSLRKFISDRSRIQPKLRTGACSKHQRRLTREIKHARHLALLPFIPSI